MSYEENDQLPIIDAHIHLDQYDITEQNIIIDDLKSSSSALDGLISVSMDLTSSINNLKLAESHSGISPAFGYHPEQESPSDIVLQKLFSFMHIHKDRMVAIGEVGLPYYLKKKNPKLQLEPYQEALEAFIRLANTWNKPIVLHAIYEDADTVCELLEKHSVDRAHFHWFKGAPATIERMIHNGYYVSVTPDCVYEPEIHRLIEQYPIERLLIETDGPWPFSGPFSNRMTHPKMMHHSIAMIASLKKMDCRDVYRQVYDNTKKLYLS